MPALNFTPSLAPKVKDMSKRMTIRQRRKRPFAVGEPLYLFSGMRTRNCQRLGTVYCGAVMPCRMTLNPGDEIGRVWINDNEIKGEALQRLAVDDGFPNVRAFFSYFINVHNLRDNAPLNDLVVLKW